SLVVNGTVTFATRNAGTGILVTATNLGLTGSAAGNYVLSSASATTTASINKQALTITAAANSKTYDGNISASARPTLTEGTLASGEVGSFSESYDNKNVSSNHVLTPSGSIADANSADVSSNYDIHFA